MYILWILHYLDQPVEQQRAVLYIRVRVRRAVTTTTHPPDTPPSHRPTDRPTHQPTDTPTDTHPSRAPSSSSQSVRFLIGHMEHGADDAWARQPRRCAPPSSVTGRSGSHPARGMRKGDVHGEAHSLHIPTKMSLKKGIMCARAT